MRSENSLCTAGRERRVDIEDIDEQAIRHGGSSNAQRRFPCNRHLA
jgi:hypothetical protein